MNTFIQKVINTWGKKGEDWLNQLPSRINLIEQDWELKNISPIHNMSYNYVALATQNNSPVVLKLSCDAQSIIDEYQALNHFAGQGVIRVLNFDQEQQALLLQQAIPGNLLKEQHPLNIEDTIEIYADVIKTLAKQPLNTDGFTHVSKWCEVLDQIQDSRIEQRFVKCACQLRSLLLDSIENEYLCHGDLHLENIVLHQEKWLAIDPKGVIGEMAFEAAAFDLLNKDEIANTNLFPEKIFNRINKLSSALNLNYVRLLSWIFLRVIISAQWFIEDKGNPDEMIILMKHLYSMLQNQTYYKLSE